MIRFCCEHCAHKISVQDKGVGKKGKCPKCGGVIVVPAESTIIEFYCENCGRKISVLKINADKKAVCPQCNNMFIIPPTQAPGPAATQNYSGDLIARSTDSPNDLTLLDVQEQCTLKNLASNQSEDSQKEADDKKELEEIQEEVAQAQERRFHWFIDVFLYPTSPPGLKHLTIFAGIPPLMGILGRILPIQLSYLYGLISLVINVLIFLYSFWYIAECIRDSADGWVRAPQGMGALPDTSDMFRQLINTIGCLAFFLMPVGIYVLLTGRFDIITGLLLIAGIFFYPIGFLSVVLFDSVSGLNPRVLLRSIGDTFLPYLGLVLLFVFFAGLALTTFVGIQASLFWKVLLRFVVFYMAFILAHLTGRFYWRYRDKLKWNLESLRERQSYD
jgi:hypothetical protein